jgi:hypothetical protein
MRRLITVFGVVAVVAVVASAAWADGFVSLSGQLTNTYYFQFGDNDQSAPQLFQGNLSTPWTAGDPLNITLLWKGHSTDSWTTITTLLINDQTDLSGGLTPPAGHTGFGEPSAYWATNYPGYYPGYFTDDSGATWFNGQRPAHSNYESGAGQYYLPNSYLLSMSTMQFELEVWSGASTTYAGDTNTADWVAQSGPFTPDNLAQVGSIDFPQENCFDKMPNLILQHPVATPEPSTILLMASGLVGLLAYAWRRRK